MRRGKILRQVILPQATRIAIAPLLNNRLTAIKQTSYVSVVGVWELTYAAREVVERTLASFQIFLGVMAIYFVICYPLSLLARWSEERSRVAPLKRSGGAPMSMIEVKDLRKSFGPLDVLKGISILGRQG